MNTALFKDCVTIERNMSVSGATVRVEIVPLEGDGELVRIRRAWRRGRFDTRFSAAPDHERDEVPFEQLNLTQPFGQVFAGVPRVPRGTPTPGKKARRAQ